MQKTQTVNVTTIKTRFSLSQGKKSILKLKLATGFPISYTDISEFKGKWADIITEIIYRLSVATNAASILAIQII